MKTEGDLLMQRTIYPGFTVQDYNDALYEGAKNYLVDHSGFRGVSVGGTYDLFKYEHANETSVTARISGNISVTLDDGVNWNGGVGFNVNAAPVPGDERKGYTYTENRNGSASHTVRIGDYRVSVNENHGDIGDVSIGRRENLGKNGSYNYNLIFNLNNLKNNFEDTYDIITGNTPSRTIPNRTNETPSETPSIKTNPAVIRNNTPSTIADPTGKWSKRST